MNCSINSNRQMLMSWSSTVSDSDDSSSCSKKEVRFATSAKMKVYKKDSVSQSDTWYSTEDYKRFRAQRFIDAVRIKHSHPENLKEKECVWGLENMIVPDLKAKVAQSRSKISRDVLYEQAYQRTARTHNPHDISKSSSVHSAWSKSVAQKKALFYSNQVRLQI